MSDIAGLQAQAMEATGRVVRGVPADRWDAATPCAGWDVPGSVYAGHRLLDVLVHGWDLAAATEQDYALDPGLMQARRQIAEPQLEPFRGAGALGPRVAAPADASEQPRFLALPGRAG